MKLVVVGEKLQKIKDLKGLLDAGTISEEEFKHLKQEVLKPEFKEIRVRQRFELQKQPGAINGNEVNPMTNISDYQQSNLTSAPTNLPGRHNKLSPMRALVKYAIAAVVIVVLINFFNEVSESQDSNYVDSSTTNLTSEESSYQEPSVNITDYSDTPSDEPPTYYTDGQKCTWCEMGQYQNGTCSMCGTVSDEKEAKFKADLQELHPNKICHYCQGTGRIDGGECVQCIGTGVR